MKALRIWLLYHCRPWNSLNSANLPGLDLTKVETVGKLSSQLACVD
jgi:hypothetical protein